MQAMDRWTVGQPRALQRSRTGAAASSRSTRRAPWRCVPRTRTDRAVDLLELVERPATARAAHAAADPLLRHPGQPGAGDREGLPGDHRRVRVPRPLTGASTPSRSTSSATWWRRSSQHGAEHRLRPGGRQQARAAVALALLDTPGALIICNGYKDRAYIETALLAQRLGRTPDHRDRPLPRARPRHQDRRGARHPAAHRGAGAAHDQGRGQVGRVHRRPVEVRALGRARSSTPWSACAPRTCSTASSCCTSTSAPRSPPSAPTRMRCARRAASSSACTRWEPSPAPVDVGGGLGVDYDGSQTNFHSSMNYSAQEYANDVVACDPVGLRRGRGPAPRHRHRGGPRHGRPPLGAGLRRPRRERGAARGDRRARRRGRRARSCSDLDEVWQSVSRKNAQESLPRRVQLKEEASTLFSLGYLDLRDRARVERLFWALLREDPDDRARDALRARGARGPREGAGRHLLRQPLGLPDRAGPLGGEAALPGDADPSARRGAHPPRRVRRSHLRQRRQDRPVHRPARREGRARAARLERRALLHRHVPGGRLPGDPRRPPQPLRRHRRGPRAPRRGRPLLPSTTSSRATTSATCWPTCSTSRAP